MSTLPSLPLDQPKYVYLSMIIQALCCKLPCVASTGMLYNGAGKDDKITHTQRNLPIVSFHYKLISLYPYINRLYIDKSLNEHLTANNLSYPHMIIQLN